MLSVSKKNQLRNVLLSFMLQNIYRVYFLTLTLRDADSHNVINKYSISNFFKKLAYRGVDISGYIWVKELQKRGVVHYHVILISRNKVSYADVQNSWKHGFVFVRRVRSTSETSVQKVINYLLKYLTKDEKRSSDIAIYRRRWGRGGVLRFPFSSFVERIAEYSEFDYLSSYVYRGRIVRIYRYFDIVMEIWSGVRGVSVRVYDMPYCEVFERLMFSDSSTSDICRNVLLGYVYSFDAGEIVGYSKFSEFTNNLVFSQKMEVRV